MPKNNPAGYLPKGTSNKTKLVTRTVTGKQTTGNDWRTARKETGAQRQAGNKKATEKAKSRRKK